MSWGEIGDAVNLRDALYTLREGQVKFSVLPHSGTLPIHFPEVNCISPHPISNVSVSVNAAEQTGGSESSGNRNTCGSESAEMVKHLHRQNKY